MKANSSGVGAPLPAPAKGTGSGAADSDTSVVCPVQGPNSLEILVVAGAVIVSRPTANDSCRHVTPIRAA
jgi:hypothetical protein